ncbi:hypothetical protein NZD85_04985 [Empedobacter stercoris]|uniref:hypothetical protein n=1 Tax=Empedobacter stercoris TaxID=1628248 RepID=UPI0021AE99EA|nr:hypothetical protein [Empedobacter stercoris]UWX67962.1 hypothetical protein NZD85_04985 [Empedobacter stercoris]
MILGLLLILFISDNKMRMDVIKSQSDKIKFLEERNETYQEWIETLRNENTDLRSKYYRDFVHQQKPKTLQDYQKTLNNK